MLAGKHESSSSQCWRPISGCKQRGMSLSVVFMCIRETWFLQPKNLLEILMGRTSGGDLRIQTRGEVWSRPKNPDTRRGCPLVALRSIWLLSLEFCFSLKLDLSGGKRKSKEEKISVTETTISRPSFENLTLSLGQCFRQQPSFQVEITGI